MDLAAAHERGRVQPCRCFLLFGEKQRSAKTPNKIDIYVIAVRFPRDIAPRPAVLVIETIGQDRVF